MCDTSIRITCCNYRAPRDNQAIYSQIEFGVVRQGVAAWESMIGVRQVSSASDFLSISFKGPETTQIPSWVDMNAVEEAARLYFARVVRQEIEAHSKVLPSEVEVRVHAAYPCEDRSDGGWQITDQGGIPF